MDLKVGDRFRDMHSGRTGVIVSRAYISNNFVVQFDGDADGYGQVRSGSRLSPWKGEKKK